LTEIRPIRPHEAEEFLELLCNVFGLEIDRARSLFFTEPMFDLRRKWGLFEGPEMLSILTTVPLTFGWGQGIGIAGVATREDRRREGLASRLLDRVTQESCRGGEIAAYLFAKQPGVYAANGFEVVDRVIRGEIVRSAELTVPEPWDFEDVHRRYSEWAAADPARLQRDERRWRYWQWNLRVCTNIGDGYVCTEGGVIREAVSSIPLPEPWMLPPVTEWVGLESMTEALQVPLVSRSSDLLLMAKSAPSAPQMFMTDQF
jgi:GNAT superfamily N-acetyltransferase